MVEVRHKRKNIYVKFTVLMITVIKGFNVFKKENATEQEKTENNVFHLIIKCVKL